MVMTFVTLSYNSAPNRANLALAFNSALYLRPLSHVLLGSIFPPSLSVNTQFRPAK